MSAEAVLSAFAVSDGVTAQIKIFDDLDGKKMKMSGTEGTDLSLHSADDLAAVAKTLNARPRKVLGWQTPNEAFEHTLHGIDAAVATTV